MILVQGLKYGLLNIRQGPTGEAIVDGADEIVALSPALLVEFADCGLLTAGREDSFVVAGQVRYVPIGVDSGRFIICQRVDL
jgi:hypothetical protein